MSIDQSESTSTEAPVERPAARSVDDFLADLDAVLADSAAPVPTTETVPEDTAAATTPEADQSLKIASDAAAIEPAPAETYTPAAIAPSPDIKPVVETPATPPKPVAPPVFPAPRRPRPVPKNWWDNVYKDDKADQDTFTGNLPEDAPAPTSPTPAEPVEPVKPKVVQVVKKEAPADSGEDDGDDDAEGTPPADAPSKARRAWGRLKQDHEARREAPKDTSGGFLNNPRGRQVIFAATAYGMGWSMGLDDWVSGLLNMSDQYAIPGAGCTACIGIVGLSMRNRFGGLVFASSLALIAVLAMAGPAVFIGGSLALGSQLAYRVVRGFTGEYGQQWPWKAVVWAAHIPAATTTVEFILHGTN
ncbi:hypothetical protein AB0D98_11000 [Streptomyces sp. NPDC047987]|uniref:hypothetical protein n=1 Tax=unclassified Streptomyces TaxID=2593676 RepID=UPI003438D424